MADKFTCFVCKARVNTISDLHLHQTGHSVDQLSLALLTSHGVKKTEDLIRSESTDHNFNKTPSKVKNQQMEPSTCMTGVENILPTETAKKGRRRKNIPQRNIMASIKKPKRNGTVKRDTTPVMKRNQNPSKGSKSEISEMNPIQQPQLSSTINTPLPPRRTLRKKALVNYYDVKSPETELCNDYKKNDAQSKPSEAKSSQSDKVRVRCSVNCIKTPSSDKNSPMLKSMLTGKRTAKDETPLNTIDSADYKYLQPKCNIAQEPNFEIKENITSNQVYQNYVEGFESYKESMKKQENYVLLSNKINLSNEQAGNSIIQNRYILPQNQQNSPQNPQNPQTITRYQQNGNQNQETTTQYQQNIAQNQQHISYNQHLYPNQQALENQECIYRKQYIPQIQSNVSESVNHCDHNSMMRNSELGYSPEEPYNDNFLNKTFQQTLCNWRSTEYIDNNHNEDSNIENLDNISLSLNRDVTDILAGCLVYDENSQARNPYWEDNMDKYFPSETDSSSEIEQFNGNQGKSSNLYAMDVPLNLVVTQPSFTQTCTYSGMPNNALVQNFNEFAECISTWSEEYMNYQPQTSTLISNNYFKSSALSSAYKYKMFCTTCGENFCNQNVLAVHFKNCRGQITGNEYEMQENQTILDRQMHKIFYSNTSGTTINVPNNLEMTSNNYHCHICKIRFLNRTNYCRHILNHIFLQKNEKLCAACGLMFNDIDSLQDHESQCALVN